MKQRINMNSPLNTRTSAFISLNMTNRELQDDGIEIAYINVNNVTSYLNKNIM